MEIPPAVGWRNGGDAFDRLRYQTSVNSRVSSRRFYCGGPPYPRLENRLYQLFPQIFQFGEQGISLALITAETADAQPFDTTFLPFIERNKGQKGHYHRVETDPPFGEDHDEDEQNQVPQAEEDEAGHEVQGGTEHRVLEVALEKLNRLKRNDIAQETHERKWSRQQ